jgi:hypothetical protein
VTLKQSYKLFNLLVLSVLVFAIVYVLVVNIFEIKMTCQNRINNIPCENCGVTRGLFYFFNLNFSGSIAYSPKSFFLGIAITVQLIARGMVIFKLQMSRVDSFFLKIIMIEIILFFALMVTYKWF